MDVVTTKTMIRFRCPSCGKVNKAAPSAVGRSGSCCRCGRVMKVPPPKRAVTRAQVASREALRRSTLSSRPSFEQPAERPHIDLPIQDSPLSRLPDDSPESRRDEQTDTHSDSAVDIPTAIPPARPPIEPSFAQRVAPLPTYGDGDDFSDQSVVRRLLGSWLLHLTVPAAMLSVLWLLYGDRIQSRFNGPAPAILQPGNAPQAATQTVQYEVVVDGSNQMQYVVRRLTASGPDASVWNETRYASPPPGFPSDAPVRIETSLKPPVTERPSTLP